jgi:hypothetical protein
MDPAVRRFPVDFRQEDTLSRVPEAEVDYEVEKPAQRVAEVAGFVVKHPSS